MELREHIDLIKMAMVESDDRTVVEKIIDLISHDKTPDPQRRIAVDKLLTIMAKRGHNISPESRAELMRRIAPSEDDRRGAIKEILDRKGSPNLHQQAANAYRRWSDH